MQFDAKRAAIRGRGVALGGVEPLIDGRVPPILGRTAEGHEIVWTLGGELAGARLALRATPDGDRLRLSIELSALAGEQAVDAVGVRFAAVTGVERYFRNGYQSWDGSYLTAPGDPPPDENPSRSPSVGYAFTALLPREQEGCLVLGFTRCDRFQNRFRFAGDERQMSLDVETLWDRVSHGGRIEAEPLVLYEGDELEESFREWSRLVAAESPLPPRIPERRLTGWCSWYNLYAAIDEAAILEHLAAAKAFRDERQVPLDIFLIDDGFTPEMGDWLDVKPQFPRGMQPLVADIAAAGFTPGLWIAPFMVGNRSKLFRDHPDWVVRDRASGQPIAHMTFYGEFRWHKRSEEYYILDVTHPEAEAYIRKVFRAWRQEWGAGYFKTDFMLFGAEYGPDRAVWHTPGLSRIAIWRNSAAHSRPWRPSARTASSCSVRAARTAARS